MNSSDPDDDRHEDERLATIRHDLINCVTSLRLRVALLRRDSTIITAHTDSLQETVERMEAIIRDWRQIADPKPAPRPQRTFNLVRVVERIAETVRPAAQLRRQTFTLRTATAPISMLGAEHDIARAVENLLTNAIKYTPDEGVIHVSVGFHAGRAVITIQDSGIGIPKAELRQVFRPFYRAANALASGIPGTGLGLHQVKEAIERHDGQIRLFSRPGCGTRVELHLPVSAPQADYLHRAQRELSSLDADAPQRPSTSR